MVETTKYVDVTKKISQQPKNKAVMCGTSAITKLKVVAQLENEMRALIQEMETVIGAVTEKLSKDPNTRVCNQPGETGRQEELRGPHF